MKRVTALLLAAATWAGAQVYYREQDLGKVDRELDRQAWQVYRGSAQLDNLEAVNQGLAQQTAQRRAEAARAKAGNQALAGEVQWRTQLVEQQQRINAAAARNLAEARADLCAESQRVRQAAEDCDRGFASLETWKAQVAQRNTTVQASLRQQLANLSRGEGIVAEWQKVNAERQGHLEKAGRDLEELGRITGKREAVVEEKNADLDESMVRLRAIADAQRASLAAQKERKASLERRRAALDRLEAAIAAREKKLPAADR